MQKQRVIRLRAERVLRGWTQRELALRVGLYPGDVSALECGRTCFPGHVGRVAELLGVPVDRALEEVELEIVLKEEGVAIREAEPAGEIENN